MTSDRDRRRRGGPAGRRRDWQGWNDPNWNGQDRNEGWYDDPRGRSRQHNWGGDWHARGWSGDWQATAWSEADDNSRIDPRRNNSWDARQDNSLHEARQDSSWDGRGTGGSWGGPGTGGGSSAEDETWGGRRGSSSDDRSQDRRPAPGGGSGREDVPRKRVRIGDAERDQAVAQLSDHFVAGRLTQAEFEERSEQATKARYSDEFEALFDDLPVSRELQPVRGAQLRRRPGPPPAFMMIMPFLMLGLVISSVALAAPWLLWGVFWVVMISGISRRRGYYRR
ncbi:DUF1707 domain-containing protein [Kribbella sp. NPDC004536]|uniref:DUF1707 SHOCT-like domain-containing protein n=1 Tax=Kribbella sp. NPDC004536 TaxID=3364106 RepID=UPI0036B8783B